MTPDIQLLRHFKTDNIFRSQVRPTKGDYVSREWGGVKVVLIFAATISIYKHRYQFYLHKQYASEAPDKC